MERSAERCRSNEKNRLRKWARHSAAPFEQGPPSSRMRSGALPEACPDAVAEAIRRGPEHGEAKSFHRFGHVDRLTRRSKQRCEALYVPSTRSIERPERGLERHILLAKSEDELPFASVADDRGSLFDQVRDEFQFPCDRVESAKTRPHCGIISQLFEGRLKGGCISRFDRLCRSQELFWPIS